MKNRQFQHKLWIFGDSFGYHNANWVHELSLRSSSEVVHLGFGGSSVQYLLLDLLKHIPAIEQDDRVVILITNPGRFYLSGKHYHSLPFMLDGTILDRYYLDKKMFNKEEIDAMVEFVRHFYDPLEDDIYKGAIVAQILNNVIPTIKSKYVQYLYSISPTFYTENPGTFVYEREGGEPPAMWECASNFIRSHNQVKGLINSQDSNKFILDMIKDTPNHWVEHPDYFDYFWNEYDHLLKHLYSSEPLV